MKIEIICRDCGEIMRASPYKINGSKIILTLDENHVCHHGHGGGEKDKEE